MRIKYTFLSVIRIKVSSSIFIDENEQKRMRNMIRKVADCIWKEIQVLEDVNIIKIPYEYTARRTRINSHCSMVNILLNLYFN